MAALMGTLRFYLAVCVFIWHCWAADERHFLHSFAAVYCFFIMSGFYISMALTERYTKPDDVPRFYVNRVLRLFPVYLVVLALTAVAYAVGLTSSSVTGFNGGFDLLPALNQITVLPRVLLLHFTLNTVPEATGLAIGWYYTVGLEMMFYALAPFFLRWKPPNLILLFVCAGALHFVPWMLDLPARQWQYEFFPMTAVFFIAGSLSYRLYDSIKDETSRYVGWLVLPAMFAYGYFWGFPDYTDTFPPLMMYAAFALLLPFLFIASQGSVIDKFLADISYPFYVVHGLGAELVGGGVGRVQSNPLPALAVTIALSIALAYLQRRFIDGVRNKIRRKRL